MQKAPIKVSHNYEEVYIHNDEQGRPQYAFIVRGHTFARFHAYEDFTGGVVELPQIDLSDDAYSISHADMLAAQAEQSGIFTAEVAPSSAPNDERDAMSSDEWLQYYAEGGMTIARDCFAGHDHLRLQVVSNYSVKLEDGCFDPHADIELTLPKDIGVKRIERSQAPAPYGHSNKKWLLVAHQDFHYLAAQSTLDEFMMYDTHEYQPQENESNIIVKHLPIKTKKLTTCNIAGAQCSYLSHLSSAKSATTTHIVARDWERDC